MKTKLRQALRVSIVALLGVTGLVSCGGVGTDGNNNQGVVFGLLGFYSGTARDCLAPPPTVLPITGLSVPLSLSANDGADLFAGEVITAVALQNNLAGQAISVDRANLDFFIPGSAVQPPSTIQPLPLTLGPNRSLVAGTGNDVDVADEGVVDTSLPVGGYLSVPECSIVPLGIVPPQIRSWISLNRSSLPEAPFDLFVTVTAEGESTSGQRYTTNEETIVVLVTPDVSIAYAGGNATNVG